MTARTEMELLESRRLTGPGLLWDRPGSVLDISCAPEEGRRLAPVWEKHLRRMLNAVGWSKEKPLVRELSGGVCLAFSAPIDALNTATTINEWALQVSLAEIAGSAAYADFDPVSEAFQTAIADEANPPLLALQQAARENDVAFLWDEDHVSLGLGRYSQTWPFRELPAVADLDWSRFGNVPTVLITGTNGKTTTARLCRHILQGVGRTVGMSSTEWIAVNDRIIERGDWSGPGGARAVLREKDVDVAILETARGGLLRRGLAMERTDVALITNVAEDHLGDFGSRTLHELLDIKWIVTRAVAQSGTLILNANDPLLVGKSAEFRGTIVWISEDAENAVVDLHLRNGGVAFVLDNHELLRLTGDNAELICMDREIPITLGGVAKHNIVNALAAAALTDCLGVPLEDIASGLKSMTQRDNPGRGNLFAIDGFHVLVDFAHNPHAMDALMDMAQAVPATRRLLAFGQAGDRTDALIRELASRVWAMGLDTVHVTDFVQYARGREPGVVIGIIRDELQRRGARDDQMRFFEQESAALDAALEWAKPGDLVIMLALADNRSVIEKLESLASDGKS